MTYFEALIVGYVDGDKTYSRGYVSRTTPVLLTHIKRAGERGPRAKQLYVELPCSYSTRYHIRQYLVWAGEGPEPEWGERV